MAARRMQSGLTLLEMVVVLVVAGLALTLGFQSLQQWHRAESALSRAGGNIRELHLSHAWWSESMRGITGQFEAKLEGEALKLSASTLTPLLAQPGSGTAQQWTLEDSDRGWMLTLEEEGRRLVLTLPETASARFVYLDGDGKSQSQWPPRLGIQKPLPRAVGLLLTDFSGHDRLWFAAINAPTYPYLFPLELETQ